MSLNRFSRVFSMHSSTSLYRAPAVCSNPAASMGCHLHTFTFQLL